MKLIIAGDRNFTDYDVLLDAIAEIKAKKWKITEIVSGGARGADALGERWAKENKVKVKVFGAEWNNLDQKGAKVKTNQWNKEYNANAGFFRNIQMAEYGDALLALQPNGDTSGTQHMINRAKDEKLKIHIYTGTKELEDGDYLYEL